MNHLRILVSLVLLLVLAGCQASDFVGGDNLPMGQGLVYFWDRELWTADVNGQEPRRITADLTTTGCPAVQVAPNGRSVAYRDRANLLWLAPLRTGEARQLTTVPVDDITWFPNSNGLAYSSGNELFIQFLTRTEKPQRYNLQDRRIRRTTWSPDTRTIAFYVLSGSNQADLAVVPFPAMTMADLRVLDRFKMEPGTCPPAIRWAPDSTRLVAGDGKQQFAYFLAGGSPIPLGVVEPAAAWTTDSRRLVYVDSKDHLVMRDLASGALRPLASGDTDNYRWSPDGNQLAFTLTDTEGSKLMLFDQTTQQRTTLVADAVISTIPPQWSANGQSLYFGLRGNKGQSSLARIAIAGGPPTPIVSRATGFRLLERPTQ
jgi:tricorn protease